MARRKQAKSSESSGYSNLQHKLLGYTTSGVDVGVDAPYHRHDGMEIKRWPCAFICRQTSILRGTHFAGSWRKQMELGLFIWCGPLPSQPTCASFPFSVPTAELTSQSAIVDSFSELHTCIQDEGISLVGSTPRFLQTSRM